MDRGRLPPRGLLRCRLVGAAASVLGTVEQRGASQQHGAPDNERRTEQGEDQPCPGPEVLVEHRHPESNGDHRVGECERGLRGD